MKTAVGLAVFLVLFSLSSWAQETDYEKRNTHVFCSSHLTILSESMEEEGEGRQGLASLSRMHREAGETLGATKKHFDDVVGYLKTVRSHDRAKWSILSAQSKQLCLPNSG